MAFRIRKTWQHRTNHNEQTIFPVRINGFPSIYAVLTISEDSWWRNIDGVNYTNMVEHGNPVPMDLGIMYKRSDVHTLGWIANTGTNRNGDFFIMVLIQRLVQVVSQRWSIVKCDVNTFTQWPWTLHATNQRLQNRLNVSRKAPKSRRDVAKGK